MPEIVYKDLSFKLCGLSYEIKNKLGSSCSEKQYQEALEFKLKSNNIFHEREKDILFKFDEGDISGNKADFVIENKIVIDLKAKKYITRDDFKQMLRYLKAGKYRLGLIINLGSPSVVIKRVMNSDIK